MLQEGKTLVIKGVKRILFILILFGGVNVILFIYSLYMAVFSDAEPIKVLIVFLLGLLFIILAGYKAYQFALTETVKELYQRYASLSKNSVLLL